MAPHEYEALIREERLRWIGALFYEAVVISLARKQALAEESGGDSPGGMAGLAAGLLLEGDLAFLRRYAGPGEIAPLWKRGVHRSVAARAFSAEIKALMAQPDGGKGRTRRQNRLSNR